MNMQPANSVWKFTSSKTDLMQCHYQTINIQMYSGMKCGVRT
jgi:hypothetical protein